MNPAFRWNVFGQWGSLTCELEVMTTSSSWHGGEGDPGIAAVLAQLLTVAEIPGSKTTKDMYDAQVSLQVGACVCGGFQMWQNPFPTFVNSSVD